MFSDILQSIVDKIEGCVGALIMGLDGIMVEKNHNLQLQDTEYLDIISVSVATLLNGSISMATDTKIGLVNEMILSSDNLVLVSRFISRDYFLFVGIQPNGNLGRARFELRKAQLSLEKDFI